MEKEIKIGIIGGKGRMGTYFANIFKKAGYLVLVSDQHTRLTNKELARKADVVIVSVPIDKTQQVIEEIAPLLKKNQLLMDLTSLKEAPVKTMLKSKAFVIGLHPMFSDQNSLPGQTVIACPARAGKWTHWIKKILTSQGAKVRLMKPAEHDKIMATVQSLVHFSDIALGDTLRELKIPLKKCLEFSTPSSELKIAFSARILAQDANLYGNIQLMNPHSGKVIRAYLNSITKLSDINRQNSLKKFTRYFEEAGKSYKDYKQKAFSDTNYLIHAILERRKRIAEVTSLKKGYDIKKIVAGCDLAVLGPPNTFTDIAAQKHLPRKKVKIGYLKTIPEIFAAVEKDYVKQGIIPVENLLHGSIRETFDELYTRKVHITRKILVPIKHALVALNGVKKNEIDTIFSHPQAISQCKKFLDQNFGTARKISLSSTMAAYEKIKGENDRHSAAIIPEETAKALNINIIAKDIADHQKNQTHFLVIEKGLYKISEFSGKNETMIGFEFSKDQPGQLFDTFSLFAGEKINLSRIESRPSKDVLGTYIFYLDLIGHPADPKVKKTLKLLERKTSKIKILGTYLLPD
jgi:prephenate dehydrogenase